MSSTHTLSAAAQDRKSRLAQLKSLKRKQPQNIDQDDTLDDAVDESSAVNETDSVTKYLSGRNYDSETKNAKLGFDVAPTSGKETLEQRAAALAEATKIEAEKTVKADQPLDLFTIQPKKPNWDLKRDLEKKLEILNVRTNNAVARMVRERIAKQQNSGSQRSGGDDGELGAGASVMDGTSLLEAAKLREREDEEDAVREREQEAEEDRVLNVQNGV